VKVPLKTALSVPVGTPVGFQFVSVPHVVLVVPVHSMSWAKQTADSFAIKAITAIAKTSRALNNRSFFARGGSFVLSEFFFTIVFKQ
jgi:hypothetical protein